MSDVAALDPALMKVAALNQDLEAVAELKEPLVTVSAILQPDTYVPMFGCFGLVLFLAIWGGVKLGRR